MTQQRNESFDSWKRKIANRKPTPEIKNRLLTTNEMIEKLRISRTTIHRWSKSGKMPAGKRLAGSKLKRWSEVEVDNWMKEEGF